MSIQFRDDTNFKGLVQFFEKEIGADRGFITGTTSRLKDFAAQVNVAWDDYVYLALKSSGAWQFDDSAHTDYPIIKTNIVSGQSDYNFTTDEQGNLILDIYRVGILPSATATLYQRVYPKDVQSEPEESELFTESTAGGTPYRYDKTANGIFLEPEPNYNATNGLKLYINREPSYFVHTDTTKKPGCPGIHHKYFYLKPALEYARQNGLESYNRLREEVVSLEGDEEKGITGSIERYFSRRSKDETVILKPEPIIYE